MDSNNLNLEVEFVDKTRFEIEYKDLSVINGKSIKKVETVSESTESGGVSIYKIFREDDVVLGTLYIKNGIQGIQGEQGLQGNGILSVEQTKKSTEDKGENVLTITDTNGKKYTFVVINGSQGSQGIQGIKGDKGESISSVTQTKTSTESSGENIISVVLTNGQTFNFSIYNGRQGIQGVKGDTGVGISSMEQTKVSTEDNGENIFTFTTSDGNTKQFSIRNGSKGSQGEPFQIKKVYTSIASMNAGYSTDGLPIGSFVIIDTGSVEDSDTGKLYVKSDSGYKYLLDLSGSQGIQGPQGTAGVGVSSVEQTTTSTEDSGNNVITITLTDGTTQTINVKNGSKGSQGVKGDTGTKGDKGDKGDTGPQGIQGIQGEQGPQGPAVPLVQTTGQSTTEAMSQKAVTEALGTKAPESHSHVKQDITDFAHNHDDRYYTENEIDTKVNQLKSDLVHNIVSLTSRSRRNITNDLANLPTAIAEQNLEKYGYKIGDYFIGPSGYQYNLADMDSYYGGYNSYAVVGTHHCGIVVDTKSTCQWLSSGTATSYSASDLHAFLKGTVLNNIKSDMIALFGGTTGLEHLLSHTEFDNGPDGWGTAWNGLANTYICALSESQIYGNVWSGNGYQTGTANKKLELFSKYRFNEIFGNISIHLRSLRSASIPCTADSYGVASFWELTDSLRACGLILFY